MSTKQVAQIVIETLQEAGVKHCYGIVGDTLNYVTDAIHKSQIDWIHVRHEEVGAFAAGAEAYLTGHLTACAGSCGPGSLHFINGLFEAHRNGAPVVLIASQIVTAQQNTDFPQEVDFKAVYSTCSVFCEQIINPKEARKITTMAAQTALNKKGVAVIILPADISQAEVVDIPAIKTYHPNPITIPNNDELQQIVSLIKQGKKIGIYAGLGCQYAHDELIALAAKLKAPIAHTSRAKDFVEYNNPYNVGLTGMFGMESGFHMVKNCDTLLLLGADFAWSQFYPDKANIIQIDKDASHLGRRHPIAFGAVGDIKATLTALLPLISEREDTSFLEQHQKMHINATTKLDKKAQSTKSGQIHPQYLVELLDQYATDDALFTADGGSPMVWLMRHINTNGKRRTLTSLKHGTMANAMPQALGLQKAFPNRQVISISGDGGLAMLLGDLLTAIQENLPIKIVVLNNGSLNFVELEQKVEGLVDNYTDLKNPDFAKLAEVIGFYGRKVTESQDLEVAVKEFLAQSGPALLDVHTSPYELVMPPQIEMGQVMGMALYGAKATLAGRGKEVVSLLVDNFLKK
ncbi:thiamine pyrophosphate-binding protein [Entomomonas sp. E2T0]|uniref:thiamine pyrophosphate-dependent enzyme n=1 Tax=Entomomonas sp. E2T0 TaxID=2930213 RepID=UPI002228440F|nr:thiamine pyrophosphate-dependent enzyme [Entomomonas sp. E2T0]UYZ83732.1 thiamine pyrophosphate-binding protein [Entomomonas sp. E2T0]